VQQRLGALRGRIFPPTGSAIQTENQVGCGSKAPRGDRSSTTLSPPKAGDDEAREVSPVPIIAGYTADDMTCMNRWQAPAVAQFREIAAAHGADADAF
jgi:hypothetical protein